MLSLFFVSWLPLSSVPATLSWFGWLLWGLEQVRTRGVRMLPGFALIWGLMLLAGHLQFAFYGALLSLLYALWLGYETRADGGLLRYGLTVGAGYLLGGMLAAAQVLPALIWRATAIGRQSRARRATRRMCARRCPCSI